MGLEHGQCWHLRRLGAILFRPKDLQYPRRRKGFLKAQKSSHRYAKGPANSEGRKGINISLGLSIAGKNIHVCDQVIRVNFVPDLKRTSTIGTR